MTLTLQPQPPRLRIKGRSFMAFVLAPEPPIALWLQALDAHVARSPNFFRGRVVVLDCAAIGPEEPGWGDLIGALRRRDILVVDVTGLAAKLPGAEALARGLVGGRDTGPIAEAAAAEPTAHGMAAPEIAAPQPAAPQPAAPELAASEPAAPEPVAPAETSLIVREPVRSGQTIIFPDGDVTILGGVASGAEIFAAGCIHVYGALRGRAQAGAMGNAKAQVFCRRLEAELVSIDGFYVTAETMDPKLRGRAAQIRLEQGALIMAPLD